MRQLTTRCTAAGEEEVELGEDAELPEMNRWSSKKETATAQLREVNGRDNGEQPRRMRSDELVREGEGQGRGAEWLRLVRGSRGLLLIRSATCPVAVAACGRQAHARPRRS